MRHLLLSALAALTLTLGSCEKEPLCGCMPPPRPAITAAALTQASTWYLSEYTAAGQITRDYSIKDRFALRFAPDGSYRRILLSDDSETAGTWKLNNPDNRMLILTDHKGDPQEFVVQDATNETLFLYRPAKTGSPDAYLFKTVR
ncbi:hypothetical protein CDA63_14155 [Hymenobacter amundsenii]|uniref:Lipocalin-like domain-containing protein n=1 Tax=Hymenobacter amundsenii TaxID=2006685 RepID=A0A246FIT0_9BACT|nr:hypothetical protein [Hymenobacter amundsenii]OWP62428.1 hypothetical protein CDA63_14155 [Hymenobacter amundsenii]